MKPGQKVIYRQLQSEGGADVEAEIVEVSRSGSVMIKFNAGPRVTVHRWVHESALVQATPPPPLSPVHAEFT